MGIPSLMDLRNTEIPTRLIPFSESKRELAKGNTSGYVHFYEFDDKFSSIITDIEEHIEVLKNFDGVITPDCTLLTGQSNCLQATNTYFNRAVGYRLQQAGIPVICNLRWSDNNSYPYAFLGVPHSSIVSISTYGTIRSPREKLEFREGLVVMLDELEPTDVIVYGGMPDLVFGDLKNRTRFHQFDNWIKMKHLEAGE
jgi:hypothetical protein